MVASYSVSGMYILGFSEVLRMSHGEWIKLAFLLKSSTATQFSVIFNIHKYKIHSIK